MKLLILAAFLVPNLSAPATAGDISSATAFMKTQKGTEIGVIKLIQMTNGLVLRGDLHDVPPGWHAIHVHAGAKCEPPFISAGPHYNPTDSKHGLEADEGPHAGDLPNIFIEEAGRVKFDFISDVLSLDDDNFVDGTALVIHAGADDYRSDPAGNSGDRIACGVITADQ